MRISTPKDTPNNLTIDQTGIGKATFTSASDRNFALLTSSRIRWHYHNLETMHTVSQTMNMALRWFLPVKYIAQAEELLKNGKRTNGVNIEEIEDERVRQKQ